MPLAKGYRRLFIVLGLVLAGFVGLWVSVPLWLPWVLRPMANQRGVYYSGYKREGYRHFALQGISVTNQSLRFRAERVEALVPSVWDAS